MCNQKNTTKVQMNSELNVVVAILDIWIGKYITEARREYSLEKASIFSLYQYVWNIKEYAIKCQRLSRRFALCLKDISMYQGL